MYTNNLKSTSILSIWTFIAIWLIGCTNDFSEDTGKTSNEQSPWEEEISTSNFDDKFGIDTTKTSDNLSPDELNLIGNWYGSSDEFSSQVFLQLLADGTFKSEKTVNTGKFENTPQYTETSGTWTLENSNSQLHLISSNQNLAIYSNRYPHILTEQKIILFKDSIDTSIEMIIDTTQDTLKVNQDTTDAVRTILSTKINANWSDHFSIVGTKVNSKEAWQGLTPDGYNYGNKVYKPFVNSEVIDWEYAQERATNDPNYVVVITYDDWQTHFGHRINFDTEIMENPEKLYQWFEIWKTALLKLKLIDGPVLVAGHPDPMATWSRQIQGEYQGDPKNVPAKLNETRHPDVLELSPHQSFAGIWQTIDYMRRKYAPNVMISYTLKTWGSTGFAYEAPEGGWEKSQEVQKQADYLNNYGVQWDVLTYNFNPTSGYHTDEQYKAAASYFGAVSQKLTNRDKRHVMTYVWKTGINDSYYDDPYGDWIGNSHVDFFFRNIQFLADSTRGIGMTIGYGNQLQENFPPAIQKWLIEYFKGEEQNITPHGTIGKVMIR
ncbi:hypothetical protein OAU52_00100 [bacterium]|nr:hypothetical protein [bacterium]